MNILKIIVGAISFNVGMITGAATDLATTWYNYSEALAKQAAVETSIAINVQNQKGGLVGGTGTIVPTVPPGLAIPTVNDTVKTGPIAPTLLMSGGVPISRLPTAAELGAVQASLNTAPAQKIILAPRPVAGQTAAQPTTPAGAPSGSGTGPPPPASSSAPVGGLSLFLIGGALLALALYLSQRPRAEKKKEG